MYFSPCSFIESTESGALTPPFSLSEASKKWISQDSRSWGRKKAFPLKITKLVLYNAARCLEGSSRHSAMKPSSNKELLNFFFPLVFKYSYLLTDILPITEFNKDVPYQAVQITWSAGTNAVQYSSNRLAGCALQQIYSGYLHWISCLLMLVHLIHQ